MYTKFEVLPPIKRFRMMQKQQQNQESSESMAATICLPAKKRKEALYPPVVSESEMKTNYCLPAKKRVWALQPDLVSDKPSLPLDLNVEWNPCFNKEEEEIEESLKFPLVKSTDQFSENIEEPKGEEDKEKKNETGLVNQISESSFNLENRNQEDVGYGDDDDDDGIVCAICQSTDGDSTDPIVFCDRCDLMVHATCYGNPLVKNIPEGDWFCAQCLASNHPKTENLDKPFACCLCPVADGAMKPTNDGLWAHVVCAVLVPEVFFEDPEGREGIDCSKVPKTRRDKKCYLCRSKRGCAIECSEPKCPLWFHVTCGLKEDLCIEYKEGKKGAVVAGFCKDHTELWKKQQQTGKFKIVAREEHKK